MEALRKRALCGLSACVPKTEEDAKIGCANCWYGCSKADAVRLPAQMIEDIREVLKNMEPVKPILKCEGWNKQHNDYVCPICKADITYEQNYCSECGRAMAWE